MLRRPSPPPVPVLPAMLTALRWLVGTPSAHFSWACVGCCRNYLSDLFHTLVNCPW